MKKNLWNKYDENQLKELHELNEKYKMCLNECKTERETIALSVKMAEEAGYRNIEDVISEGKNLNAGDKVYACCMKKAIALFQIGEEPISHGMNILGAHVDSPRIDIKRNPLYESDGLGYLDTHYYGGVKKYQWVTEPLALHGVIAKKDGTVVNVNIGEDKNDPVFVITDLLVHLGAAQLEKPAATVIEGENLDILIASRPLSETELKEDQKEAVKQNVLNILCEKYGMDELDFQSAELEIVPAGKARDCGLDRSMILSYGHDDRICAFPSLFAILEMENTKRTSCCLLVDKEEIGSMGATGMQSKFFENMVAELVALTEGDSNVKVRRALQNSKMLSSDVSSCYDPLYPEYFTRRSTATIGFGITFNKHTGSKGKNGSNDANAEYLAELRRIMDDAEVGYQIVEMGKVDVGGSGTIAFITANYGMQVIDCGVSVLNMHAPYEVGSKADIYEAYRAYKAFLKNA
ncbi:aminopeptidase [Peptacetobacter sp.]|uniref:aminopeptidase n=1 Tax=Peptacetobacter sp. TaxID=2991975 RepID=UPI003FA68602